MSGDEDAMVRPSGVAMVNCDRVVDNEDGEAFDSDMDVDGDGDSDSDESEGSFLPVSLSDIETECTYELNMTDRYVLGVGKRDAFRECYQNWRDGILSSNGLHLRDFRARRRDKRSSVVIRAFAAGQDAMLGFIRLRFDSLGRSLGLQLVNFNANLPLSSLLLGGGTKQGNSDLAGHHGEGLNIAALTFLHKGFSFRIHASGFVWDFECSEPHIHAGNLICYLKRLPGTDNLDIDNSPVAVDAKSIRVDAGKDVCVEIGGRIGGRKTRCISREQLNDWLDVTLDVDPPHDAVQTVHGDLLEGPRYANKLYCMGLLLADNTRCGTDAYRKGYNFLESRTTRFHESLEGNEREAIARIWMAANQEEGFAGFQRRAEFARLSAVHSSVGESGLSTLITLMDHS